MRQYLGKWVCTLVFQDNRIPRAAVPPALTTDLEDPKPTRNPKIKTVALFKSIHFSNVIRSTASRMRGYHRNLLRKREYRRILLHMCRKENKYWREKYYESNSITTPTRKKIKLILKLCELPTPSNENYLSHEEVKFYNLAY